ncbi:GGDEF domain-containing protein [Hyphomonas sp.]|uniref:GGDEF domain-containing protein n=1 Tax=Hyphomonas sp. TaxID=87 RepID=UPI001D4982DC|nr:GGDEF domain-containing protein [Hyphomonas sp.]MBU3920076.1 GGDEF domain-containing protein [Alphaproteobacteria bacterium]MBU4061926.1 GGDEF domain-containing protein [Alphaproteobacteria bacterium]MBU4166081.1 GGDEF domain-containing protein [Alphaproteobacteria bacterium]
MAKDFHTPDSGETRALLEALGLDLTGLDRRTRAAVEALGEEVMALRDESANLRAALADAELLADNDALVPIFNRRAFEREVRREIALAGRFQTPLSLIFIDLDNFKLVNDIYGHAAGDGVLLRVSEILMQRTRETDIVGRLGGDEFGVVLAHATFADSQRKAAQLADAIDALEVRDEASPEAPVVRIGASCGVVEWRTGQGAAALIARADQAMFLDKSRRKAAGRAVR